jgi:methylmalonyl-CoA/ethylmalonyl-CoA epimerase
MKNLNNTLKFHHIGIAVRNIAQTKKFYGLLGYVFSKTTYDSLQNVYLAVGTLKNAPMIELIAKGKGACPIDKYLKRSDHVMYHVCYETHNLTQALRSVAKTAHLVRIGNAKRAIVFGKKEVSFY